MQVILIEFEEWCEIILYDFFNVTDVEKIILAIGVKTKLYQANPVCIAVIAN